MTVKLSIQRMLGTIDDGVTFPQRFTVQQFDELGVIYNWEPEGVTLDKRMYLKERTSERRPEVVCEEEPTRGNGMVPVKPNDVHQEQTPEDSQEERTEQLELGLDTGVPSKRADNNPLTFITLEVQS